VGQLGNIYRYGRAESAFADAGKLERTWPWPPYGRGLAKYGLSEAQRAQRQGLGLYVGVSALDASARALTAALTIEPGFRPALVAMDRVMEGVRRPATRARALTAMRVASAGIAAGGDSLADPAVLLGLGRMEREAGNVDSALSAFAGYLDAGGLPGLGRLELARTRLAHGLPGGEAAYYAGAEYDDSLTVEGYRNDLAVILSDSELTAFDAVRGADRADYLRRFWGDRDRLELRKPGERLAEHYRRLEYARRNFALSTTRRIYSIGCNYRSGSMDFDDRGVIYIRHGEPSARLRTYLFQLMPNESWRYDRPDGDLFFHFGAPTAPDDYRLFASVVQLYGACRPETRTLDPTLAVTLSDLYLSRQTLSPMYAKLGAWTGTIAGGRLAAEEQRIGSASIAIGTQSDSYERRFAHPLNAAISLAAVGRQGGKPLVHIVYGLPGERLVGTEVNGYWRYPITLRFAAYGPNGRVVASADTTVVLETPARVAQGSMLFGRFMLAVPPGQWRYRLSLADGDSTGIVTPSDSLLVPRLDGGLVMSDPVLGWRRISVTWDRGADTVFFSPFHSYFGATELELYYEVYGMTPGSTYQTELLVSDRKDRGGAPARARIRFGGVAGEGMTGGRRTLDLREFKPGSYWLDLIVTDAAGHRVQRRTWFEVKPTPKLAG
jgi:GWxTD domain-containing protein